MNAPIWTTILQSEPKRLPNNGSKTIPPTVYEYFGRVVVDSQDLAYYLGVPHDRLLKAWDHVIEAADREWRGTHFLPRTERFGCRAGVPFHDRDARLTREAAELSLKIINRKKASAAISIFESAAAREAVVREPSQRLSDILKSESARARARVDERAANGANCADGDDAALTLDDPRWNGVRFEIVRPTMRSPSGTGRAWECKAYRIDDRGRHRLSRVAAFDERLQEWVTDQFVTIPDALLVSFTPAEDHKLLSGEVTHA